MTAPEQAPGKPSDAQLARQAAIQSVASNLAMIALVMAFSAIMARRSDMTRAARHAVGIIRRDSRRAWIAGEVAAFRRDVTEISHAIDLTRIDPERVTGEP